jgi:hypothetical protein
MAKAKRFKAKLLGAGPNNAWTFLEIPFDVKAEYGRARLPVKLTINRHVFRSTVAVMHGKYLVSVCREVRDGAGVKAGDELNVQMEHDTEPRVVETPEAMLKFLRKRNLADVFDKLAYTHMKEYVRSFAAAKQEETRQRRLEQMAEKLSGGGPRRVTLRSSAQSPTRNS